MEFVFLFCGIVGYFLPWMIASHRNHKSKAAIAFVTVFLGWTGFGWLVAMIWSLTDRKQVEQYVNHDENNYINFSDCKKTVTLDGRFSKLDLEKIIYNMKK